MGKDAFIATNFVLIPITSLSQGPMSQGPRSQNPGSRVSGSRVPGPGSQVLILDYAVLFTPMILRIFYTLYNTPVVFSINSNRTL